MLGALGELPGILGGALGIQTLFLGIRHSILGMASLGSLGKGKAQKENR